MLSASKVEEAELPAERQVPATEIHPPAIAMPFWNVLVALPMTANEVVVAPFEIRLVKFALVPKIFDEKKFVVVACVPVASAKSRLAKCEVLEAKIPAESASGVPVAETFTPYEIEGVNGYPAAVFVTAPQITCPPFESWSAEAPAHAPIARKSAEVEA